MFLYVKIFGLFQDTPVGTKVFSNVEVNDVDIQNAALTVVCTQTLAFPEACNIFYVNTTLSNNQQWMGDIYLQRPLDYETMVQAYQLTLTAKVWYDYSNTSLCWQAVSIFGERRELPNNSCQCLSFDTGIRPINIQF